METDVRDVSIDEAFEEARAEGGEPAATEPPRPRPAPPQQTEDPEAAASAAEEHQDEAETNSEEPRQKSELEEEIEILAPPVAAKEWTFGEGEIKRTYIQCELSVIGSAQWFKLFGEFLEEAMTGEHAMSLNSLLQVPTPREGRSLQVRDFQEADMFVLAIGKLLTVMPEFLEKSVCIWLDVPDYEWPLVRELMRKSPVRGGMSHDDFEEIVGVFIDQNYSEIERFFRERFPRLRNRYTARAQEASRSRSQKR